MRPLILAATALAGLSAVQVLRRPAAAPDTGTTAQRPMAAWHSIASVLSREEGQGTITGIVDDIDQRTNRAGRDWAVATLVDSTALVDVEFHPKTWAQITGLRVGTVLTVSGRLNRDAATGELVLFGNGPQDPAWHQDDPAAALPADDSAVEVPGLYTRVLDPAESLHDQLCAGTDPLEILSALRAESPIRALADLLRDLAIDLAASGHRDQAAQVRAAGQHLNHGADTFGEPALATVEADRSREPEAW